MLTLPYRHLACWISWTWPISTVLPPLIRSRVYSAPLGDVEKAGAMPGNFLLSESSLKLYFQSRATGIVSELQSKQIRSFVLLSMMWETEIDCSNTAKRRTCICVLLNSPRGRLKTFRVVHGQQQAFKGKMSKANDY